MSKGSPPTWRRGLPWIVSAATLGYVFGYATDWPRLLEAMRGAHIPLYVFYTAVDKLIFFLWWGVLQATAVRRFVTPVSTRQVVAVRGGAELARTINGALGDAAFIYGMSQLTAGRIAAVVAAFGVPVACHFVVLVLQMSLALVFLPGGPADNPDISLAAGIGWSVILGVSALARMGYWERLRASPRLGGWLVNVTPRTILPYMGWFALFAAFDVFIQGLASRAFGVDIEWWALAGRIPVLYFFISLPSFGNFGTREIAWAACFSEFAERDQLIAYALATNTLFLLFHVVIGVIFLPRALHLIRELRAARREGRVVPSPFLRDASDP